MTGGFQHKGPPIRQGHDVIMEISCYKSVSCLGWLHKTRSQGISRYVLINWRESIFILTHAPGLTRRFGIQCKGSTRRFGAQCDECEKCVTAVPYGKQSHTTLVQSQNEHHPALMFLRWRWEDEPTNDIETDGLPTFIDIVNSSPPGAAYMHQWIGSALVQIMAWRLFGAKPLSKPMLSYCQLDPWGQTSLKF